MPIWSWMDQYTHTWNESVLHGPKRKRNLGGRGREGEKGDRGEGLWIKGGGVIRMRSKRC